MLQKICSLNLQIRVWPSFAQQFQPLSFSHCTFYASLPVSMFSQFRELDEICEVYLLALHNLHGHRYFHVRNKHWSSIQECT
jgi:hypothetical protein